MLVAVVIARPVAHVVTTAARDVDHREPTPPGQIDDASRLNATPVHRVVRIGVNDTDPESQIVHLLKKGSKPIKIGKARKKYDPMDVDKEIGVGKRMRLEKASLEQAQQ